MGNSLTSIENKWTEKQLDAIIELRGSGATRQQLAHKLGINRNSLYKTLKAALFDNYNEQLESIVLALVFMDSKTAGKEQNE